MVPCECGLDIARRIMSGAPQGPNSLGSRLESHRLAEIGESHSGW